MKRINTILIFFLFFFTALSAAGWAFLQSRAFGRLLSKAITEVSSKKFDAKVRFNRIDVRFFPPGVALENVHIEYDRKGTKISAEAGELGVLFDIETFRNEKFRLREVFLNEGYAELSLPEEESSGKHPWDVIQTELEKLPIDIGTLSIQDSRIAIFDMSLDVHKLKVEPGKKEIKVDGQLKQLKHSKMPSNVDLISVKGKLLRNEIQATKLQVIQKRSQIKGVSTILNWAEIDKLNVSADVETEIYIPDIKEWIDLAPVHFYDGILKSKGKVSWNKKDGPRASSSFILNGFSSNVFHAELVEGEIISNEKGVTIPDLRVKNKDERLKLLRPAVVWDQEKGKILPDQIRASVDKLELNNALTILGEPLKPLKGQMSGEIAFTLNGTDLYFSPAQGFKVEWLRLEIPKEDGDVTKIVNAPVIWVHDSRFNVVKGAFEMKALLKAPRTQLNVEGSVSKEKVHFDVTPGQILLTDLGNIAGLDLKGEGENKLTVRGKLDDVKIKIEGQFRNFEILGYRLGHTDHVLEIGLKEGVVDIPKFVAKKNRYNYSGTGEVNFKNFLLDLSIDLPQISFTDLRDAIHPLSGGLSFLPSDFEASLQGNVDIFAKGDIANLKVGADVYGQKITAYGESFKDTKFGFVYGNKIIQLKDFSATKEAGRVEGRIGYNLNESRLDYQLSLKHLSSSEISFYKRLPLSMDFKAAGEFQGSHNAKKWRHRGFLGLSQTRIHDKELADSTFEWELRDDAVTMDAKFAKDWIVLSANSQNERGNTNVNADLNIEIPDLPLFMRGILGENAQLTNASGELSYESHIGLTNWQWNRIDAQMWLKSLKLVTNEIGLQQRFNQPQVRIQNGNIQYWNAKIDAVDFKLSSKAQGDLRQNLVIQNNLDFDAKYLEILSRHVQRAEGRVSALIKTVLSNNDLTFALDSSARDLAVSTDLLPFALSSLNYKISFFDRELEIENINFRPDSGKVQLSGAVLFSGLDPDVNLKYSLERAAVPIKNRSQITLSGDGLIFGNKPPYILNGDITINKGSILNELTDFGGQSSSTTDTKYLPKEQEGPLAGLLNLDLGVNTENPINLNNSMMDVFLLGELQLTGDFLKPNADGRVQVTGNQSKVFFKNSEYQLSKGEFLFNARKPITKPDFDVAATSVIANYKVTAKAFGNPDSFTFDLSSDPALSKQNILSLIAFGYTDDLSNSISASERQNLTNVGVGSFIFDQFKVTDIVKKQFGLQVNLGTVFVQSSDSMLTGRSSQDQGTSSGTLARTRTATNIEVKKRLSEAMSLSVSSTVGGSIGQRQRMNLNYGLTRNLQLEGVYELRTNAEGTEDIIDNSIGGDVKYRMTFK